MTSVTPASPCRPPRTLHVVLQHQGRAGGSLVAALLAQYHQARGVSVLGFDLAPVAPGLTRYAALGACRVVDARVGESRRPDARWCFDLTLDRVGEAMYRAPSARGIALAGVVDVGAANFREFFDCCAEGAVGPALAETGVGLVLHAVAAADEAVPPEAAAYYARAAGLSGAAVVWLNDGCGAPGAERGAAATRAAAALAAALAAPYRVAGAVHVPSLPTAAAPGAPAPAHALTAGGRTFAELLRSDQLGRATRRALRAVRDDVFAQIARALGDAGPPTPDAATAS